jgi:hypothetical protein
MGCWAKQAYCATGPGGLHRPRGQLGGCERKVGKQKRKWGGLRGAAGPMLKKERRRKQADGWAEKRYWAER